jgi:hypothetical protein
MEENAELTNIKGLGRTFSWKDLIRAEDAQLKMFTINEMPCDCYDGE